MRIKISYPNDTGSDERFARAIDECVDEEGLWEAMASAAKSSGCRFVESTDYGAIWDCPTMPPLPEWAGISLLCKAE